MAYNPRRGSNKGEIARVIVGNEAEDGSGVWHIVKVNTVGEMIASHDTTGLGHGVTTVTTAGTDVVLAASTACKWVVVQAQTDNTNKIAVGATGVDATVATGTGIILEPGDAITIIIDNLADIYIDSLVNGEGCRYLYGS